MSNTPRKVSFDELAPFNAPDSELLTAIRFDGEVYAGVRVGGAGTDRHAWIYGRYGEHKDAKYEGFWAYNTAPLGVFARNLALVGATRADTSDSPDFWQAANGNALELSWVMQKAILDQAIPGEVRIRIWNAVTGADVSNASYPLTVGEAGFVSAQPLPSLATGAYTVWLRFSAPSVYNGLPLDFQEVTGMSPESQSLLWVDSRTGRTYKFAPKWAVGALPPDGALREEYDELLAANQLIKRPEWNTFLYEMDENGEGLLQQTEWSMVRLLVGNGVWPAENLVHPGACPGPALRRLVSGQLVPQGLRASLRSIGAFKEIEGVMFVGAMEAGTDGRYASIIETPTLGDSETARGQVVTDRRYCECALLNETLHGIARFPDRPDGTIYGVSSCELFERVDYLAPGKRLVGSDPGGRSLVVCHPQSGRTFMARAVESDFTKNSRSWHAFSYLVSKTALGQVVGPGVSALYNSVLWEWNGRVYGICDADPDLWATATTDEERELATSFQSLGWYDGTAWHKVARWPQSRYYLTRGGACGPCMLLFGRRESDRRPVAFRFDGTTLESNLEFPYYVERADTTISADGSRETLLLTCVKADPNALDNTVLPGFYLVETNGDIVTPTLVFPCVHDNAVDGQCDRWCLPRGLVESIVGDLDKLVGCYGWTGSCWQRGECSEIRTRGVWLEIEVSEDSVCFVRHGGPMPYDTELFDGLRWTEGRDCIDPVDRCENARCAYDKMPEGTVVYVGRYAVGAPLLRFGVSNALAGDGAEMSAYWHTIWARADAETPFPLETGDAPSAAMLAEMEQFKTRVAYGAPVSLLKPAQKWVDVLVLIPPGYKWTTAIQSF